MAPPPLNVGTREALKPVLLPLAETELSQKVLLLTVAVPQLEEMANEGEAGRKQIAKYTRYLTVVLGAVQACGLLVMLSGMGGRIPIVEANMLTKAQIVVTLTAGTCFLLWIGEQITEKGIGN